MRISLARALVLGLSLVVAGTPAFAAKAAYGKNLIKNPDAEVGEGSNTGADVYPVPSWQTSDNFTVTVYGASGFPAPGDPGPPMRGLNFFAGGPGTPSSSAQQSIDVSALASGIDTGSVGFTLSGWLGGFESQDDQASLRADFTDLHGSVLGTTTLAGPTASERNNVTGLFQRVGKGSVPAGTRKVLVVITMTRAGGDYNDGYADALSLVLKKAGGKDDVAGERESPGVAVVH
jgi:hypothetical protein